MGYLFLALLFSSSAWAQMDALGSRSLNVLGADAETKLNGIATNLNQVFQLFRPQLDSDSEIVTPYAVSGSAQNPSLSFAVRKCVLGIVCQMVNLRAQLSLTEVRGPCDRNLSLNIDLSRSSANLANEYRAVQGNICFHRASGRLDLLGYAVRAPRYTSGIVAEEILGFLKLQVDPIVDALQRVL
jgi:hypothetical protein